MRQTKARRTIMHIIEEAGRPLDASDIMTAVARIDPEINRATVFRTLNTLVSSRVIIKVDFGDGKARYESSAHHHHHHLICTQCGSIQSVDVCKAEELVREAARRAHFTVTSHKLEYFGLCRDCRIGCE